MLLEGTQIDHYHLMRHINSGGMGEVYLAEDTQLERQVAIKIIRTDASRYATAREAKEAARLFLREAQIVAKLEHSHILPLFGADETFIQGSRYMYMIMPFRGAGSFADWLDTHEHFLLLSLWEVERIIRQMASALQYAHNQQIIHQDVKPSNMLIQGDADEPKQLTLQLADFGVAKLLGTTSESQDIRGTPIYMAPEQWEGRAVPATDQYALAVVAYELLTGRPPFIANNNQEMWHQHHAVDPAPPSDFNPNLSSDIDEVLLQALAKDPAERFGSIAIFARAFRQAILDYNSTHHTLTISSTEARLGTTRTITLPGRRQLQVAIPAGAYDGQVLRLEGQGHTATLIITIAIVDQSRTLPPAAGNYVDHTLPVYNEAGSSQPQRGSRGGNTFKLLLALLIIAVLIINLGYFVWPRYFKQPAGSQPVIQSTITAAATSGGSHGTPTAQIDSTGTAEAHATASAQAISTAISATQTAEASASATAVAISTATSAAHQYATATATATAYDALFNQGTLKLNDSLSANDKTAQWDETNTPDSGSCIFQGDAYHSAIPAQGISPCFAQATNFTNFSYQVQMIIVQGDQGGVIFRGDETTSTFYYFFINKNGSYTLETIDHNNLVGVIYHGADSAIKTGLDQTNLLGIFVNGTSISLYVNKKLLYNASDSTLLQGQIGVIGESLGGSTNVAFMNAVVRSL